MNHGQGCTHLATWRTRLASSAFSLRPDVGCRSVSALEGIDGPTVCLSQPCLPTAKPINIRWLHSSYCRFLKTFRFAISRGAGLHFGERGRLPLAQAPAAPRAHESCAVQRQKRARHIKVRPPGTLRPRGAVRAAVCACWARTTCLRRGMPARAAPRARRAHAGGLSPRRCCAKHVEGGPPGGLAAAHR